MELVGMLESWKRIFTISKKPDWEEYKLMLKVITLGVIVIALIGYVVLLFFALTKLGMPPQ